MYADYDIARKERAAFNARPKLLVIGYARHGKDTVGEILRDNYGFKFTSSSMFVVKEVMWDNWGIAKYADFEEMYEDRVNHRVLWMEMISAYNTPDKTKTASTMIERGFDLYVGMRRLDELDACKAKDVFDHVIWVDASDRHPPETGSMDITPENAGADFVIDNNGTLEDLEQNVAELMHDLGVTVATDAVEAYIDAAQPVAVPRNAAGQLSKTASGRVRADVPN